MCVRDVIFRVHFFAGRRAPFTTLLNLLWYGISIMRYGIELALTLVRLQWTDLLSQLSHMELDTSNSLRRCSLDASVQQNIRDIADLTPLLKPGRAFRSSFLHSVETRKRYEIEAVLDLRRSSRLCRKHSRVMKEVTRPDWMWVRLRTAGMQAAGSTVIPSCPNCQAQLSCKEENVSTKVRLPFLQLYGASDVLFVCQRARRCRA